MTIGSGLFRNDAAISELASKLDTLDAGSSSHWQEMHRTLRFENGRVVSAVGFGGFRSRPSGLRLALERLLQLPYRMMAREFPAFHIVDRLADTITERQQRAYDLDVLRQSITLAMLMREIPDAFVQQKPILVIGDGFGSLTSLIVGAGIGSKVILINLTQTLLADLIFVRLGLPGVSFALVEDAQSLETALEDGTQIIALRADSFRLLESVKLSAAVNIASMQEMRSEQISEYFSVMRIGNPEGIWFYTCNRSEKTLPGGEISRFLEYPWSDADVVRFHSSCPWHQRYYTTRPPSYRRYDGDHLHRLALLRTSAENK
jgi:hypothetical protein